MPQPTTPIFPRFVITASIVSLTLFSTGPIQGAAQTKSPSAAIRTDRNIPNFAEVAPGIYRGAAPTAAGLARLKAMGVRTVIDLRIEKKGQAEEAQTAQQLGLTRLRIPLGREAPTKKQVQTFLQTLSNPAERPVFIHCQYGADRTGAMVGIWRVTHDGWDFPRTYAEMRRYGFKPFLHELKGAVESRAKRSSAAPIKQPPSV